MKAVTSSQMKETEKISMEKNGIRSIILMENAARSFIHICREKICASKKILVVCGSGNNGGDGFAIARLIFVLGKSSEILFVGDKSKMTPDCRENYEIASKMGIPIYTETEYIKEKISSADTVIDSMIGTGLKSALRENYARIAEIINECARYVISVDCPTGINSDTGGVNGTAVYADETVAFYLPKIGMYLYPAKEYCGKISVGEIGIPHEDDEKINANILTKKEASLLLPRRKANSHKGTFGKAELYVGCREMSGAACFAAASAYKVGCGLVRVHLVDDIARAVGNFVPEAVISIEADDNGCLCGESISSPDGSVLLAGCGMGNTPQTFEFIKTLAEKWDKTLILDADALNSVSREPSILKNIKGDLIITPHLKEMSRLCGKSVSDIAASPVSTASCFAEEYGATVVLKSASTVIADPYGNIFVNNSGNSSMAKGGSGDCLAGSIAGFAAQGMSPIYAASLACFVNGLAGELASEKLTEYCVNATDIISFIPNAIADITEGNL